MALDTTKFTLGAFVDAVLKRKLGFVKPAVEKGFNGLVDEEDERLAANLGKSLAEQPAGGVGDGVLLTVTDFSTDLELSVAIKHRPEADFDEKKFPELYEVLQGGAAEDARRGAGVFDASWSVLFPHIVVPRRAPRRPQVHPENGTYTQTGLFKFLAHFSRFARPGARRRRTAAALPDAVDAVAFEAPDGAAVLNLVNRGDWTNVTACYGGRTFPAELPPDSISTLVFS